MKKIYLTLILILALVFALVVVSSATVVDTIEIDSLSQNSSGIFTSSGFTSTAFASDGYSVLEFGVFEYDGSKPYYKTYIVSNIEAFQREWNGFNYNDFNEILQDVFHYYGFQEYQYNYLISWSPPVSQEQFERLEQEYSTLEQTYKQLVISNNTLQGEFDTLQNDYSRLGALLDDTVNQYNTLQGEYNTLQGEYNTLESTIPIVRQEGYSQGLEDADALSNGLGVILSAPVYFLNNVFNFEILGFSMRSIFATIITVLTIAWVTKKLSY